MIVHDLYPKSYVGVFLFISWPILEGKKKVSHLKLGMPEGNMYCFYMQYSQNAFYDLILLKLFLKKIGIFMIT